MSNLSELMIFFAGVAEGAIGMAAIMSVHKSKAKPILRPFHLNFKGNCSIQLMAETFENDGMWIRYFDDRAIELVRIPSSWVREL